MVYGGKVDEVKTILNGRMETENLDRFLNIVGMFNQNAANGDYVNGIVSHSYGNISTKSTVIYCFA